MRRSVFLLTSAIGVVGSNSLVLSPVATSVAQSFEDVSAEQVMLASAVYGLATALSALTLAPKADRVGAHRSLLWALLALLLGLGLSAAAKHVWVLYLAQGVAGLAAGVALPSVYGLTAQIAPKGKEQQTLGTVLTGWTLSLVAGVSVSALLTQWFHWRVVFVILALACAFVAYGLWRHQNWGQAPERHPNSSPLTALKVPGIYSALGACALFMLAFYGLYAYLGTHIQEAQGQSASAAGLATLSYGVGFALAVFFDPYLDRWGAVRVAPWMYGLLLLVYFALGAAAVDFWALVLMCGIWGMVNHVGLNLIVGRLAHLSEAQRGAVLGLNSAVTYLAMSVGTAAFKPLFESQGFAVCSLVSALCIVPAIIGALRERRGLALGAA